MKDDDLQSYIDDYKANLLKSKDAEKSAVFERANEIDINLSSQLLLISSVILTIIGGLVASYDVISNEGARAILTAIIIFLLLSIVSGLLDYHANTKFFIKWGDHLHKQGRIIVDDRSNTADGLISLRDRLQQEADGMPTSSSQLPRTLQVTFFLIALFLLLVIVITKIYS